jgi:hypothetical protein
LLAPSIQAGPADAPTSRRRSLRLRAARFGGTLNTLDALFWAGPLPAAISGRYIGVGAAPGSL